MNARLPGYDFTLLFLVHYLCRSLSGASPTARLLSCVGITFSLVPASFRGERRDCWSGVVGMKRMEGKKKRAPTSFLRSAPEAQGIALTLEGFKIDIHTYSMQAYFLCFPKLPSKPSL